MDNKKSSIEFIFPSDVSKDMQDKIKDKVLEPFIKEPFSDFQPFIDQYIIATNEILKLKTLTDKLNSISQSQAIELEKVATKFNKAIRSLNSSFQKIVVKP